MMPQHVDSTLWSTNHSILGYVDEIPKENLLNNINGRGWSTTTTSRCVCLCVWQTPIPSIYIPLLLIYGKFAADSFFAHVKHFNATAFYTMHLQNKERCNLPTATKHCTEWSGEKRCKMQQSIINLIVCYCGYDIRVTDTIDFMRSCLSMCNVYVFVFADLVSFSHRFN